MAHGIWAAQVGHRMLDRGVLDVRAAASVRTRDVFGGAIVVQNLWATLPAGSVSMNDRMLALLLVGSGQRMSASSTLAPLGTVKWTRYLLRSAPLEARNLRATARRTDVLGDEQGRDVSPAAPETGVVTLFKAWALSGWVFRRYLCDPLTLRLRRPPASSAASSEEPGLHTTVATGIWRACAGGTSIQRGRPAGPPGPDVGRRAGEDLLHWWRRGGSAVGVTVGLDHVGGGAGDEGGRLAGAAKGLSRKCRSPSCWLICGSRKRQVAGGDQVHHIVLRCGAADDRVVMLLSTQRPWV